MESVDVPSSQPAAAPTIEPMGIPLGTWLALGVAGSLLLAAAVAHFVFGLHLSPGTSYLAVVLFLGGLGALLAAGLKE